MASPVPVVKDEPCGGDVFHAPTDSEAEDIDIENLQLLGSKFAASSKFPVGCKVWCNLRRSIKTECRLAKSAAVVEVYIHVENGRRVYKVKSDVTTEYEATLYEDQLVYAINCPVKVTNIDTKETNDGLIIYPELEKGSDGKQKVLYVVQYLDGNSIRIEHRVASERIKYRVEDCGVGVADCVDRICRLEGDGKEDKKQPDCLHEGRIAAGKEEEKVSDEVEGEKSQIPSAVSVPLSQEDSNDIKTRWEPPLQSLQRKRSHGSDINDRPTRLAKTESDESVELKCILKMPSWMKQEVDEELRDIANARDTLIQGVHITHIWHQKFSDSDWTKVKAYINEQRTESNVRDFLICRFTKSTSVHSVKRIGSITNCDIRVDENPMRIAIKSRAHSTSFSAVNISRAIGMIEDSLLDFLADKNVEKMLLYELAATMTGSYVIPRDGFGLLRKTYKGVERWWRLISGFPFRNYACGDGQYHGKFLQQLKPPELYDCKIELYGGIFGTPFKPPLEKASPYVVISGTRQIDVNNAAAMVVKKMRKHQLSCGCKPQW